MRHTKVFLQWHDCTVTHAEYVKEKCAFCGAVKEMGAEWLLQNLDSAAPPDVSGKISLSLGTVYYSIMG